MKRFRFPILVPCVLLLVSESAPALIDIDTDGFSDIWESIHSFHIGQNPPADQAPSGDIDGDGYSNLTECKAGTNPRDHTDFPAHAFSLIPPVYEAAEPIASPPPPENPPGGPFDPSPPPPPGPPLVLLDPPLSTLTWRTVPGKTYQAIPSEDLVTWSSATGAYLGTGDAQTFDAETLYPDGTVPAKLFWRVEINDTDSDLDGLTDYEELHIPHPTIAGKTLDPFHPDTDGDGLTDGTEYIPGTNGLAAFTNFLPTDPDGPGLPAALATGLIGRWDFEETFASYSTANRFSDSSGNNRQIVPVFCDSAREGMPSKGAGTRLADEYIDPTLIPGKAGYLGIPRSLLYNRAAYSVSLWVKIDPGSITTARPIATLFSHHRKVTQPAPNQTKFKTDLNGFWIENLGNGTQTIKGGSYSYLNYNQQALAPLITPIIGGTAVSSPPVPAGTYDDGKYHHYLLVRNSALASIYRDGILLCTSSNVGLEAINAINETNTGISLGRFYGLPAETGIQEADPKATLATFDRIRVWSRALTATDALDLFRQDADKDLLWDITETNTRKWDDHNGNAIVEPGEFAFVANPLHSDLPETDHDTDKITSIHEQNVTKTKIDNPDTDGDGLPDGWEAAHPPLNPLVPDDGSLDPDNDGLTTAEEYAGAVTNPFVADAELYPATWMSIERSLRYDYDDYYLPNGLPNPNVPRKLTTKATWPGANPTDENLSAIIPYNQLHLSLAPRQPFPGTFPVAKTSPNLEAGGEARTIPNPDCHHASLSQKRIIVKVGAATTQSREFKALLLTERTIDGIQQPDETSDITLTVPAGQKQSNPYDLLPHFIGSGGGTGGYSETVQQTVINYEITEVISDQIAGNEANKLPTAYYGGHPNNPMLMGTRMGRIAKFQIAANVSPKFAPRMRIGAKTIGTPQVLGSVATIPGGGKVPLTFNARNGSQTYEIVIGFDINKNFIFDDDEIRSVFQKTPKTNKNGSPYSGGDTNFALLDKIIIVTRDDYKTARQTTEDYAYNAAITTYAPHGVALLKFFSTGATTHPSTGPPVWGHFLNASVIPSPQGLSHPLGAIWGALNTAETFKISYPSTSGLAGKVVEADGFDSLVERIILSKKAVLLPAATAAWQTSLPLPYTDDEIAFGDTDHVEDVHLALGKCKAAGELQVKYRSAPGGKIEISEVKCSGTISDLYDFAYGTNLQIPVFGIQVDLTKDASRAQAGHATLASAPWEKAGKVFFTEVIFDSGWITWNNNVY